MHQSEQTELELNGLKGNMMATGTRARRGTKAAQPAEEVEETSNGGVRAPSEMHELMADFFNTEYNAGVTPAQCAIFTSKRTAFRKSDAYQDYRAAGGDDEGDAKPARASKTEDAKPAARRGRRGTAAKAEAEEAPAEKAAPARRARRAGKAEATEDAAPAEEKLEAARRTTPRRSRRTAAVKPAESDEEPF